MDQNGQHTQLSILILFESLKFESLKLEDCVGIMAVIGVPTQKIRVKMALEKINKMFLEKYYGTRLEIQENNIIFRVTVKEAGLIESYVRIAEIPFDIEIDVVKKKLTEYGRVIAIKRVIKVYKPIEGDNDGYFPIISGWITVTMTVEKDIPSYIMVENFRAIVEYQGQLT